MVRVEVDLGPIKLRRAKLLQVLARLRGGLVLRVANAFI